MAKQSFREKQLSSGHKLRNRFWIMFFCIWLLLLTGFLEPWIGAPGLKQLLQVNHLLADSRNSAQVLEKEMDFLTIVEKQLQSNPVAQEREIRKVLGYLGSGEIVFEF